MQQVVRQQLLAALHAEVGQQFKAQLITLSEERDAARKGRARAEQLLVSLLRQLLPDHEPVSLCSAGVRELDVYRLNHVWAGYRMQRRRRRTRSERQVRTRVGQWHGESRSLFWVEALLAGEGAVPMLERADPDNLSGQGEGAQQGGGPTSRV